MKLNIRLILLNIFIIFLFNSVFAGSNGSKTFSNFTLSDYYGKEYSLDDFKDSKAIVLMFIATQCPVSNAYNDRMAKVYADYKDQGVTFLGINSNKQENIDEIREHAYKNNLDFIILKDPGNKIADIFEASFTPEIYVLNTEFKLLYHGRIDDSRRADQVQTHDLRNALDEILAGKEVSVKKTKAFGCTIKRVKND